MQKEESFFEPDTYSEEENHVLLILKRVACALRRPYRKPAGDRLSRFCTYFAAFDNDRIESFISRIGKSKAALNPDFSMDDIVSKDLVNEVSISTGGRKQSARLSSSFYSIQVMEV